VAGRGAGAGARDGRRPVLRGGGRLDAARALVASAADAELFLYPGDGHLFADRSLPSYDATAAELLTQRVLDLLARVSP
jgi:dienelactone hydrolase